MPSSDPRIDAYIAKAAEFARPILVKLRELVHEGCPDVVETMKWGSPSFEYHGLLCGMAAFQAHATFGFWKGSLVATTDREKEAMGQFGRLISVADLPSDDEILASVRKASEINLKGIKVTRPLKHPKPPIEVPDDLAAAFRESANSTASATFDAFSPSHRREYLEWITEAKTDETRSRRLATTLEWLNEGKPLNWRYMAKLAEKKAPAVGAEHSEPNPAVAAASPPPIRVEAKSASKGTAPAEKASKSRTKTARRVRVTPAKIAKPKVKAKTKAALKGKTKTGATSGTKARVPAKSRAKTATAARPKGKGKARAKAKPKAVLKRKTKGKAKRIASKKGVARSGGGRGARSSARRRSSGPRRSGRR